MRIASFVRSVEANPHRVPRGFSYFLCCLVLTVAVESGQAQTTYTPYAISTWVGSPGVAGTNDGKGFGARFHAPAAVAVDATGNVFVADFLNNTVRMITPGGDVSTLAGLAGSAGTNDGIGTDARFSWPNGVAVDGAGNLYVTERENHCLRKISPAGTNWLVTTLAGLPGTSGTNDGAGTAARFYQPGNLVLDSATNLYVADTYNHTIRKVTPSGDVTTIAGLPGSPGSVDGTNSDARFSLPDRVAVDGVGNIYVADWSGHTIREVAPVGTNWVVTTLAGLAGSGGIADGTNGDARFLAPDALASDRAGNVYVAGDANRTLRKIRRIGTNCVVTTLAGSVGNSGTNDGSGSDARFAAVLGLALDTAGTLYIADGGANNIIRKGTPFVPDIGTFTNGGFELTGGVLPNSQLYVYQDATNLAGWTVGGIGGQIDLINGEQAPSLDFPAAEGSYQLTFNGGDTPPGTWIAQRFDTIVGRPYIVTFQAGSSGVSTGKMSLTISALADNQEVIMQQVAKPPPHGYGAVDSFSFMATSASTTLRFQDSSADTVGVDLMLDNIVVHYVLVYGNGTLLTGTSYTYIGSVGLSLGSVFPNGSIFYTLDGSDPTFASTYYSGPIDLQRSGTLRVIAYSADFLQTAVSAPVYITVIPNYNLAALPAGGGTVSFTPPTGPHTSNTVVNVSANPAPGWSFLGWRGDLSGGNAATNVIMTRDKIVQAIFGTTLTTTVAGNGATSLSPSSPLYPFGTVVCIGAAPQAGNYFGVWGNAANGSANPLYFPVTNANPTVSCIFAPLVGGQVALAVSVSGHGRAGINPPANAYAIGANVTITATPDPGQTFIGWSGDAVGTQNPLSLTMSQSKSITANFTKNAYFTTQPPLEGVSSDGFRFGMVGEFGGHYRIDVSTNLSHWDQFTSFTNTYGKTQLTDLAGTNATGRYYRGAQLP